MPSNIGPQIRAVIDENDSIDRTEWVLDGDTYDPNGYNDVLTVDEATDRILKYTYNPEENTVTTYRLASRIEWEVESEVPA